MALRESRGWRSVNMRDQITFHISKRGMVRIQRLLSAVEGLDMLDRPWLPERQVYGDREPALCILMPRFFPSVTPDTQHFNYKRPDVLTMTDQTPFMQTVTL